VNDPRYPEDYLPLALASRPALVEIVATLAAMDVRAADAVCLIHAADCPCGFKSKHLVPGAIVGAGPRREFLGLPTAQLSDACCAALLAPPAPGHVQCLVHLVREAVDFIAPLQVALADPPASPDPAVVSYLAARNRLPEGEVRAVFAGAATTHAAWTDVDEDARRLGLVVPAWHPAHAAAQVWASACGRGR